MGATSPVGRLEVEDGGVSGCVMVKLTTDDQGPYALVIGNDSYNTGDTKGIAFYQRNDGEGRIAVNCAIGIAIDPTGAVLMPNTPSVLAYNSSTTLTCLVHVR